MGMQSYMATVFVGEREIGGPFVNGDFRSSLNFARRELRDTCAWLRVSDGRKSWVVAVMAFVA